MTTANLADYLDALERAAVAANVEEENYRKAAMERIKALEQKRAFAFRRLYLVRTIATSLTDAKDEAEAAARGSAIFLREVNWSGGTEAQREVAQHFLPVVMAIWAVKQAEASPSDAVAKAETASVEAELEAFERWYASKRSGTFFQLMDTEPVDLPLVEV
jgi:hypothetical protein